jgi:hypothetical protein
VQLIHFTIERTLTELDWRQNLPFPFQVPGGVTHLTVQFEYTPHKLGGFVNLLTLTLFDPSGWRGTGLRHGDHHEVVVGVDGATPGYLPGPVQPGEWSVEVDTHMIMPGPPCVLKLTVHGDDEPVGPLAPQPVDGKTASRGPGWYRGDLHGHSRHSDAVWDIPDLLAFARAHALDFTALTDHNTVAGLAEMRARTVDDLLTVGGMELTTFRGHALALGVHNWVDWRVRPGLRSMATVAAEVNAQGGLFIIAHPECGGDPFCTGCEWRHPDMLPGLANAVEVWNMDWLSECSNEAALSRAYDWLNHGSRFALTAGADNHGELPDLLYGYNVVYAEDLSETEILRAIRAGHLYLSAGPRLDLRAQAGLQVGMMGDSLRARAGETIQLHGVWSDCHAEDCLALMVDGEVRENLPVGNRERGAWELSGGHAHWCLLSLRDAQGSLLALTNPIFFDGRT